RRGSSAVCRRMECSRVSVSHLRPCYLPARGRSHVVSPLVPFGFSKSGDLFQSRPHQEFFPPILMQLRRPSRSSRFPPALPSPSEASPRAGRGPTKCRTATDRTVSKKGAPPPTSAPLSAIIDPQRL